MKNRITGCALAAALALAGGAALAQGASGIGAAASVATPGNSIDSHAGSTGGAVDTRVSGNARARVGSRDAAQPAAAASVDADAAASVRWHWNVPASAESDPDFKRWQRLR